MVAIPTRKLIKRNIAELQRYGLTPRRGAPIVSGKGRVSEVEEYWLNEPQALLIAMRSDAELAPILAPQTRSA
jgi:hypothetical protein